MKFAELKTGCFFTTSPLCLVLMKIHNVTRVYDTPQGRLIPLDGETYNCISLQNGDMYNLPDDHSVVEYVSDGIWI